MSALTDLFSDIADAIRLKKGTSSSIVASDFPDEIADIPSSNDGNKFKSSLMPVYWGTVVTTGKEYQSTNEYGLWNIKASGYDVTNTVLRKGFGPKYELDGSQSTSHWASNDLQEAGVTSATVEILFPVKIRPQVITIKPTSNYATYSEVAHFYFSEDVTGDTWTELTSINDARTSNFNTVPITTTTFYRRMKVVIDRGNTYKVGFYHLAITQGYWKEA